MGTPYIQGLLEGFRGRGEEVYQQAAKEDEARRKLESGVFSHLLQSRDPQIRALALQGIYESAQPSPRKRGWRGFLGEIQTSSVFPQIQQLANELVPEEPPTPRPSAAPGSAAMSTNVPVEQPSEPITPPGYGEPTAFPRAGGGVATAAPAAPAMPAAQAAVPAAPTLEGAAPMAAAPQAPGRLRPRGTQVPTAEEIAEYSARIPLETRIGMAEQYLDEESAKRAIMGILGAPQTTRQFGAPTFAVIDPLNGEPVPVAFDYTTGAFYFTDGTRVPRGAKFVQMSRAGQGAGLTSTIRDTPALRAQYGIDPADVTPSGYWKIKQLPDGTVQVMPSEYTPPPAFSGTTEVLEPGTGVPVRGGVPRGGGQPVTLGDAPRTEPAKIQQQAQGLLAAIDKMLLQEQVGPGGLRRRVPTDRMNALVKQEAVKLGLPYQTYAELQQAAKVAPEVTPRQERTEPNAGMSTADRIRARALGMSGRSPAPAPIGPPIRSTGPGPRR